MKKINKLLLLALAGTLLTGCGDKTKNPNNPDDGPIYDENTSVIKDQVFDGLEFVNTDIKNGEVETVVINNTGVFYEGSAFSIKIKDEQGNLIVELKDYVREPMEAGTTRTVVTKTNADLTHAYMIEYSVVVE